MPGGQEQDNRTEQICKNWSKTVLAKMASSTRRVNTDDTSKPKLWAAKICPFAEKCVVALHELGIPYDTVEVDLMNKPAALFDVNPKGLVPAMEDQGHIITDSYNILQYIDEMWARSDNKGLFPATPANRAVARTWCEYINNNVGEYFYECLLKPTTEEQESGKKKLLDSLRVLNDAMKDISDGPFFMGSDFAIVDIMLAPHVKRFSAIKHVRGFEVPETAEYERFNSWWSAVQNHPSFQKASASETYIVDMYKKYIEIKAKKN